MITELSKLGFHETLNQPKSLITVNSNSAESQTDADSGSRKLLLAVGWVFANERVFDRFLLSTPDYRHSTDYLAVLSRFENGPLSDTHLLETFVSHLLNFPF